MKLPFPMWTLNSDVVVYISKKDEYNKPQKTELFSGRANHVQQSKQVLNAQRELVLLSGWLVVPGDLNISVNDLSKAVYVEVNGHVQRVQHVNKPNNPDGSIFSTELFF